MINKIISFLCAAAVILSLMSVSAFADESEKTVQSTVYDFLTEELDLCPAAAAGIMGNVMIECGFDPDLEVIDTNDKPSYGLMMWNGPRYESLKKWCSEHGYKKSDAEGQLGYLKWELENTEKAAYRTMKEIPNTIEGAVRAAIRWASDFERCTKTSYGLRIYYALNNYWQKYAGGNVSDTSGIYGYYYNVPENIKFGEPLTLYGAVVSYSSELKSITAGVYTEDGELITGKTVAASNLVGNIGVIDRYVVLNKVPKGKYYYTITAVNEAGEYMVERHEFTVSDEPTKATLVPESEGGVICDMGASCPFLVYKDMLPANHWAHDAVDFVLTNEYFVGDGAGYFLPKTNMSRAMAVTVLHRMAEKYGFDEIPVSDDTHTNTTGTASGDASDEPLPQETGSETTGQTETAGTDTYDNKYGAEPGTGTDSATGTDTNTNTNTDMNTDKDTGSDSSFEVEEPRPLEFVDLESGRWYVPHVLWAVDAGITEGKGNGIFDPGGELSRGELAVLMYRFAAFCQLEVSSEIDLSAFADGRSVPAWAHDGISWAVDAGLINGIVNDGVTYLDYSATATREQVAAILMRFAAYIDASAENGSDASAVLSDGATEATDGGTDTVASTADNKA